MSSLIKALQKFDRVQEQSCFERAARGDFLLNQVFQFSVKEKFEELTEVQQRKIGRLLAKQLPSIKSSVDYTLCKSKTSLEPWWLKQRSALQFLVTDFRCLPVGDTILAHKFREADIDATIVKLDKLIATWKHITDSDEGYERSDFINLWVPSSHSWWFDIKS